MSKRLLVTDDAIIIREMIKETAEEAGWEIVGEASNGEEAIEQFQKFRPDAVTLDLVMPEHDGLHALRGIKKIAPDAKVLIISALQQKDALKDALTLGAFDFIVKPFEKTTVASALENMVR